MVVAFGQILPKVIIDYPPMQCLNIHPSLSAEIQGRGADQLADYPRRNKDWCHHYADG